MPRAIGAQQNKIPTVGRPTVSVFYTTVVTSSDTYIVPKTGTYRVMCLGSGGTGSGTSGQRGGGSALPAYAEIDLTAGESVALTIAAGAAGQNQQYGGTPGAATSFGAYLVGTGGAPGGDPNPGPGWGGGGDPGGDGGTLGNDGGDTGAAGAGPQLLTFLQAQFSDVTLATGTAGSVSSGGSSCGGGAAGLLVNGSGPSGTSPDTSKGGKGSGYGAASGGRGDGSNAETSNAGVMLIGVPG